MEGSGAPGGRDESVKRLPVSVCLSVRGGGRIMGG